MRMFQTVQLLLKRVYARCLLHDANSHALSTAAWPAGAECYSSYYQTKSKKSIKI
jgi:hypothetical protein